MQKYYHTHKYCHQYLCKEWEKKMHRLQCK